MRHAGSPKKVQTSLRDAIPSRVRDPALKTPGYCQVSLRDTSRPFQIIQRRNAVSLSIGFFTPSVPILKKLSVERHSKAKFANKKLENPGLHLIWALLGYRKNCAPVP